jgi:hypothetical protein
MRGNPYISIAKKDKIGDKSRLNHATNFEFVCKKKELMLQLLHSFVTNERSLCENKLLKGWLGTESNRRHKDFQSFALPTELPSRIKLFKWRSGRDSNPRPPA